MDVVVVAALNASPTVRSPVFGLKSQSLYHFHALLPQGHADLCFTRATMPEKRTTQSKAGGSASGLTNEATESLAAPGVSISVDAVSTTRKTRKATSIQRAPASSLVLANASASVPSKAAPKGRVPLRDRWEYVVVAPPAAEDTQPLGKRQRRQTAMYATTATTAAPREQEAAHENTSHTGPRKRRRL